MATDESMHSSSSNEGDTVSNDKESEASSSKRGGWTTFPFIAGTLMGLTLAVGGWATNLVVYLIDKFHVKSIDATQIFNMMCACSSLLPVIAAIIADSFLGCYSIIWISSLVSALGITLLSLTSMLDSLRPQPCVTGSNLCPNASKIQFAVLYSGLALAAIGLAGTRFTIAAMGADQFDNQKDQGTFFNWFTVILYSSTAFGGTVLVYVEENVSWALGFCLCLVVNIIGLGVFLSGTRYYRPVRPKGSPFTSLARVLVAAIRKCKVPTSSRGEDYYNGPNGEVEMVASVPSKSFRFFNRAALKTEGDTKPDGSVAKKWRLCSVQQVEDLKILLRIFPVLSSAILLCTGVPALGTLTVLQVLTVDRHLGSHFRVPAGSMSVLILTSTVITLPLVDRFLYPKWQKMTQKSPTPLQRIVLGHIFSLMGRAVAALVESRRLKVARTYHATHEPGSTIPMLVFWLVPQLLVVGMGEAFHYPGQVTFYYQEFPKSLRSTSTAMVSVVVGIAYYLSTVVIDLVRRITSWLPDDINNGRLDNVYWLFAALEMLNFGYFLVCAKFYNYRNLEKETDRFPSSQFDSEHNRKT